MKEHFAFPAVFNEADDGISISFPDLPGCLSCADNWRDALKNAKSVLKLYLIGLMNDEEEIPKPSEFDNIERAKEDVLVLIEVNL